MAPVLMALNSVAARAAPKLSAKRALRAAAVQPARPAKVRCPALRRRPRPRAEAALRRALALRRAAACGRGAGAAAMPCWLGDDADQPFDAALLPRRLPRRCDP